LPHSQLGALPDIYILSSTAYPYLPAQVDSYALP
jgi:hypothetical protein